MMMTHLYTQRAWGRAGAGRGLARTNLHLNRKLLQPRGSTGSSNDKKKIREMSKVWFGKDVDACLWREELGRAGNWHTRICI
jgi:hypothetical protein